MVCGIYIYGMMYGIFVNMVDWCNVWYGITDPAHAWYGTYGMVWYGMV